MKTEHTETKGVKLVISELKLTPKEMAEMKLRELEELHAKLVELAVFDRSNLEVLIAKARAAIN